MPTLQRSTRLRTISHTAGAGLTYMAALTIGVLVSQHSWVTNGTELGGPANESDTNAQNAPNGFYQLVAPSVVTIRVRDENGTLFGTGSGFFIDESLVPGRFDSPGNDERYAEALEIERGAFVLTNYHVVEPAVAAEVVLSDGEIGSVWHIIAKSETLDLALLSVTVPPDFSPNGIPLASDDPAVMMPVYAIGSPEGFAGSASEGIVSAYQSIDGRGRWLQTTASIGPGSSGGALLQADGRLAGVTTKTFAGNRGVNFAIPISVIREFLSEGPFERRKLWEGAAIVDDEFWAFAKLNEFLDVPADDLGELRAIARLKDAKEALDESDYDEALNATRWIDDTLPNDFRYLVHFVAGKAIVSAAVQDSPSDLSDDLPTEQQQLKYRVSQQADDAYLELHKAIELNPVFSPAYEQLYYHHRLCGNWADAILTADALVRLVPRCGKALALRAESYLALGQPLSARNDLKSATKLSPADGKVWLQLANIHSQLGDYEKAIKSYELALQFGPRTLHETVRFNLGRAYRGAGNPVKAMAEFRTAKALGWSAELCDREIAECQLRVDPMITSVSYGRLDNE